MGFFGDCLYGYRYGRYKIHLILASLQSIVCFASLIGSWDGHSNFWSSLLIFSGGLGTGIAHSAVFVALANGVAVEDTAIASSGFYLSGNIGLVSGISAGSAIHQITLRRELHRVLEGRDDAKQVSIRTVHLKSQLEANTESQIIKKTLQDIDFVQNASDKLRQILVPAYVASFRAVFCKISIFFLVKEVILICTKSSRFGVRGSCSCLWCVRPRKATRGNSQVILDVRCRHMIPGGTVHSLPEDRLR